MDDKVRIKIKVEDLQHQTSTKIDKTIQLYPNLGWECDFPAEFASIINQFMELLGYPSYNKDYIFLESVTLEEYEALEGYLHNLREENK